ncbi:MAG: glycosyl hydrolase family 88, partial [Verrucomicrobiales bacterium]|nr:glycosyl hydrolase family 88 [Verrucomicrobiales bacterium]
MIRVHKSNVEPLIGPSDSAPIAGGPLALGIAWKQGNDWKSLAQFGRDKMHGATLAVSDARPAEVKFAVTYKLADSNVSEVVESYDITPNEIRVLAEAKGTVAAVAVRFPALVFDGERAPQIAIDGKTASVALD